MTWSIIRFLSWAHWSNPYIWFVVIPWHSLIHFVVLYITQGGMFAYASAFNGDISDWDTSSVTDFVSQWHNPSFYFYHEHIGAIDTFDLLIFNDTHSFCCFIHYHSPICLDKVPLMETSVAGILPKSLIL
jgi:surface protein